MRVLVTAGSTQVPIDKVRCISNIFKGKTGWKIADCFDAEGAEVVLITSNVPEHIGGFRGTILTYKTFDDLHKVMEGEVASHKYDVIIHSAAVSDYKVSMILGEQGKIDNTSKISSSHRKMYLELTPTIKLVDQIRKPWGFTGKLVKFKLQVDMSDEELLEIARNSMLQSDADVIVANCLEWSQERAYIITKSGHVENVTRAELPVALYRCLK